MKRRLGDNQLFIIWIKSSVGGYSQRPGKRRKSARCTARMVDSHTVDKAKRLVSPK